MRALLMAFALIAVSTASVAHEKHTPARSELAAEASVDARGVLWVVSVRDGRVWVQKTERGIDALSAPVALFDAPRKVIAQGENRPKIAVTSSGVILVTFTTAGTAPYSGHVHLSRSTDGGASFAKPIRLNDDARDISHRFASLAIEGAGRVRVVWVDRRDVEDAKARKEFRAGASIYTAWSDDDGETWSANQRLSESSCECCRIALAADPNGKVWALWRHIFATNIRDHALMAMDDKTPTRASFSNWVLEACPHQGPALSIAPDGVRHLAWFAAAPGPGLYYSRLDAGGRPIGAAKRVTETGQYPAIHVEGEIVMLAWTRFDGARHRLEFATSRDGGANWQPAVTLASSVSSVDAPQWLVRNNVPQLFWRTQDDGFQLITPPRS